MLSFVAENSELYKKYCHVIKKFLDGPYLASDELHDYIQIKYLLVHGFENEEGLLFPVMDKLEEDLRDAVENSNTGLTVKKLENEKKHHKILSNYLYSWGEKNGFNHSARLLGLPPSVPKLLPGKGLLSTREFNQLLKYRFLFKDLATYAEHGEFTHILQWMLIIEANKKYQFLKLPPLFLYRQLGLEWFAFLNQEDNMVITSDGTEIRIAKDNDIVYGGDKTLHSLWDYLVDGGLNRNASGVFFFLNNLFIRSASEERWPWLTAFFMSRYNKRALLPQANLSKYNSDRYIFFSETAKVAIKKSKSQQDDSESFNLLCGSVARVSI